MIALLAAAMWVTYPNPQNPNEYLTYQEGESVKMPPPKLSPMERIVDQQFLANPMLQRGPEQSDSFDYDQLERRYPVRSVLPQNQRQTMSTEDAMAMEDYRTERMAKDINIRGALLNQKIAQRDLQYKDNVITQAEAVQKLIGGLKPGSPTFDAQVAEMNLAYPLAQQNNGVQSQIDTLSQNHTTMARDQTIRNESYKRADEVNNANKENQMEMNVASLGASAKSAYDRAIAEGETPINAYSLAITKNNIESQAFKDAQLQDKPMTPQQTAAAISRLRSQSAYILKAADETDPSKLSGDLFEDYNAIRADIARLQGRTPSADSNLPSTNLTQYEGKIITQGGKSFRVTNGVAVPIK